MVDASGHVSNNPHVHIDAGDLGGAATVIAGTGAGQYRRIVAVESRRIVIDQAS